MLHVRKYENRFSYVSYYLTCKLINNGVKTSKGSLKPRFNFQLCFVLSIYWCDSERSKFVTAGTANRSTSKYITFTTLLIVTHCKEQFVLLFPALSLAM